jgi:hypothetical protein
VNTIHRPAQTPSDRPGPRRRRLALRAGAGAAAVLLAAPAGALAVTGAAAKPCYSHIPTRGSEPLTVTLTGGTPGGRYLVAATVPGKGLGSAGSTSGNFDAAGNAVASITDVSPPGGTINPTSGRKVQLTVQDYGADAAVVPLGTTRITNIAVSISSTPRSPRAHRAVAVSGTPFANQVLYGFVTKPGSSRVLRRVPLGRGNVCGYVSTKRVIAPKTFRAGSYRFYVNAGPTLHKSKAVGYAFRISPRF